MKKFSIRFEVKTACGSLEFHKSARIVAYNPAPCFSRVAENTFLFSKDGFMSMLNGYESPKGGKGIIRSKDSRLTIQSFHWIDQSGTEYRPKASRTIEAYLEEQLSYAPTVAELFDLLGLDYSDFDSMVSSAYETVVGSKGSHYSGAFGDAIEIALRKTLSPRTKYSSTHMPANRADICGQLELSLEDIVNELGIA